jgi:hypothetical protein
VTIASIGVSACGDLTGTSASLDTITDSGLVYAINGSNIYLPSALYVYSGALVDLTSSFTFDVAFDVESDGRINVIPVKAVAGELVSTHSVGLDSLSLGFDDVGSVDKDASFRADTAMSVRLQQVVLVKVDASADVCSSAASSYLYAKLVVRAVDTATRAMDIKYTTNPNCGFRSFASGIPKF